MDFSVRRVGIPCLLALAASVACAPQPSLDDPYAANGYYWPYDEDDGQVDETQAMACEIDPDAPLGRNEDGDPIQAMIDCPDAGMEMFPMCLQIMPDGSIQLEWGGANGFALFVTDPDAVVPSAPNTPVEGGETYWAIGPEDFTGEGFRSPLTYQSLPTGTVDVTTEHAGTNGGTSLQSGRCYKFTIINKAFERTSLILGWE